MRTDRLFLAATLVVGLLVASAVRAAERPLFHVVAIGAKNVEIAWKQLDRDNPPQPAEIVIERPPFFGDVETSKSGLVYRPTVEFWRAGSDSFTFRRWIGGIPSPPRIVWISAGTHRGIPFMDFEPDTLAVVDRHHPIHGLDIVRDAALNGEWGLRLRGEPSQARSLSADSNTDDGTGHGDHGSGASSTFRLPEGGSGSGFAAGGYAPVVIYRASWQDQDRLGVFLYPDVGGFRIQAMSTLGAASPPVFLEDGSTHRFSIALSAVLEPASADFYLDG